METLFLVIAFVFGTVMGSFYHVVATRLSNDESIIAPGSHCPKCNHFLKWYENIPIISYIIQKGKCRNCNSKIPISYLVVEIITGLLFMACYHAFGLSVKLIISLIFTSSLIIVIVSDIEYMIILDEVLMTATVLILLTYLIFEGIYVTCFYFLSGVGAFVAMYGIKLIGDKAFNKESLGGGDIKLMFLFGLVIGFPMAICSIFIATFIAFPISLIILFSDKENIIPFGPFLSIAAVLVLVTKLDLTKVLDFIMK